MSVRNFIERVNILKQNGYTLKDKTLVSFNGLWPGQKELKELVFIDDGKLEVAHTHEKENVNNFNYKITNAWNTLLKKAREHQADRDEVAERLKKLKEDDRDPNPVE